MPIALLKFPNDFLQEVFRLCDPFDLYKLSKCSTKCSQKLIALGGTKKWKIGFCGGNETAIWVDYPIYYFKQTDNPEDYFATRCLGGCVKQMYIEFSNGGPVDLFFYLLDTFGIGIVKLLENTFGSLDKVSEVAEALIDRNIEIELFCIEKIKEVQDVINFMPLVNQMNITQEFQCSIKFPPEFHFQFVKYPRKIYISKSFWFNINQLFNCTCTFIELTGSMLSNQDLDIFLQNWKKAGTFPNLRLLEIWSLKLDDQSPILGMIPPITTIGNPSIELLLGNDCHHMTDAVRITKDDGTEGWLIVGLGHWPGLKLLIVDPADTVVRENIRRF